MKNLVDREIATETITESFDEFCSQFCLSSVSVGPFSDPPNKTIINLTNKWNK